VGRYRPSGYAIRLLVATALAGAAVAFAWTPGAFAAPGVTIGTPLGGTVTNVRAPTFAGTAEPLAGAVTLSVYSGTEASGTPLQTPSTLLIGPEGAWSIELLTPLEDGTYTARASQTSGETGLSNPVTFTVRTTAPVVTLSQPSPAPGETTPAFSGTASESTPVTVQIHSGGSPEGTLVSIASAAGTGAGWRSSPASPALPVGHYTAVAVQKSSLTGNPPGVSPPVGFEVTPPPAPPAAGVAAAVQAARPQPHGPSLLAPFPVVRVVGIAFAGGVRLQLLKVQQVPTGTRVLVRCRGRNVGCPRAARRITVAGAHGVPAIVFRSFEHFLRAGAVIEVLISKDGEIGKYTRLRVRRGKVPERVDLCLDAGGVKPIACPAL
jgi:hypothetical protein